MSIICRICLTVCADKQFIISDGNEVKSKLCQCLQSIICQSEFLPNHICPPCMRKIEEIDNFYKKIMTNQNFLLGLVKNSNDLNNTLFEINEKKELKLIEEKENSHLPCDNSNDNLKSNFITEELNLKLENIDSDTKYSSEEDIPISNIKNIPKKLNKTKALESAIQPKLHSNIDISNGDSKDLKCLTCLEQQQSQTDLVEHYTKQHGRKTTKSEVIEFTTELFEGKISYKCQCGKTYDSKRAINRHIALTHSNDRPFHCKLCGRTYKTVSEIIRHSRAHNGVKIECSYKCGYSTAYTGALKEHEKRHQVEYKYKCSQCSKGFQVKTWFEEHQNIHSGAKPFVCNMCGLAFHMSRYLTAHKSTVHPQSSTIKRYICVHCSLPCDTRNALTGHLKEHGIRTTFLCDICGKTLTSGEQLKFHKRMHLGVKPYTCSVCPKSFSKKYNLTVHMRSNKHATTSQVRLSILY